MIKRLNILNSIFKKINILKHILYLLILFIITLSIYLSVPKLFNYPNELLIRNLKLNNNIEIQNISRINYKIFPTPRLRLSGIDLSIKGGILKIDGGEIDIILSIKNILNYKKFYYNKLLIKNGLSKIDIKDINKLFNYIKKNNQKLKFKKNKLIITQNDKRIFEIENSSIDVNLYKNQKKIILKGIFLNHKIFFLLDIKKGEKNNIIFKIPELDIISDISFENKKDNLEPIKGLINFEVFNNFFQFNFIKDENIKINKGFIRNKYINSSLKGDVYFKPSFLLELNFEPKIFKIQKLFPVIQRKYFSNKNRDLELIKKINGSFNFKSKFEGSMKFENGEILLKNFKVGKNKNIFFDAKISDLGNKAKIQFNLIKMVQYKKTFSKELNISGFFYPSSSKFFFKRISLDKKFFSDVEIKKYEKQFIEEVILDSANNIFDELKLNKYFNNFVN